MFRRRALFVFAAIAVVVVPSVVFLPWWATTLVILGMIALAVMMLPRIISRRLTDTMKQLFETKSRVLREAAVTVHTVELTDSPRHPESEDPEDDMEFDRDTVKFVLVDATIAPNCKGGPMTHWEPAELRLVGFDRDTSFEAEAADDDERGGDVADAQLVVEGEGADEDFGKIVGTHRVRLIFACPREMSGRAKLQYYFEGLGDLKIPA